MTWDQLKQCIDDAINEQLDAGFNQGLIEIDYIDIGSYSEPNIEIVKNGDDISLRVIG